MMPTPQEDLIVGRPVFDQPSLQALRQQQGPHVAWRQAFTSTGAAAPAQVSGGFAVGLQLVDGRTFLAVDRFAIEPMCYRVVNGQLRFAQHADALADSGTGIDPQALYDYLYFHVIPSPRTVFKGVFRLPPGHCAVFHNGQLTVAPYWVPAATGAKATFVN